MPGSLRLPAAPGQSQFTTVAVGFSDVTLQQLTFFLAAAEHGSFTAAAGVLPLARPSVSEQIANLEAELFCCQGSWRPSPAATRWSRSASSARTPCNSPTPCAPAG